MAQPILFLQDYERFPTAAPDDTTSNISYLRLASKYQQMGIRNYYWHLTLVNQSLKGIDPRHPDLDAATIMAIAYECAINPWYYFREIAHVPGQSGSNSRPLLGNRGNMCLFWCFFNHITNILIQVRQTGKSISADSLMVYLLYVLCFDTNINLMTKDSRLRIENIDRLKSIATTLPYYLDFSSKKDANNGIEITVMKRRNKLKTHVPQSSLQLALNSGRGMTTPILFVDESPFQRYISTSLPAALPAMSEAKEIARKAGAPYALTLTTTAGKINDPSGAFIYNILQGSAQWNEAYFDAHNEEELYEIIKKAARSKEVRMNSTFSHRQLGQTDEWLSARIRDAMQDGEDALRDYLNSWTEGTGGSPFSPGLIARISGSRSEPNFIEIDPRYHFTFNWYIPKEERDELMKSRRFILGMDSSNAVNGDYIGLVLVDAETFVTVGAGAINDINIMNIIDWIGKFMIRYENVLFIPENRSTGQAIIDGLLLLLPRHGQDPFARIFNWVVQDPVTHQDKWKEINRPLAYRDATIYQRCRALFGFATSGKGETSRDTLTRRTLAFATGKFAERIGDAMLIDQLLGLEIINNRVDHAPGGHDDLVIAWLMCAWFMTRAMNVSFYGIEPLKMLSDTGEDWEVSQEDRDKAKEQALLREELNSLIDQYRNERDPILAMRIEQKIVNLDGKIKDEDGRLLSVQDLITQVNEVRKKRIIDSRNKYHSMQSHGIQPNSFGSYRY